MEQGFYKDKKLILHLKQFLKRSFGVGSNGDDFEIREVIKLLNFFYYYLKLIKIKQI